LGTPIQTTRPRQSGALLFASRTRRDLNPQGSTQIGRIANLDAQSAPVRARVMEDPSQICRERNWTAAGQPEPLCGEGSHRDVANNPLGAESPVQSMMWCTGSFSIRHSPVFAS